MKLARTLVGVVLLGTVPLWAALEPPGSAGPAAAVAWFTDVRPAGDVRAVEAPTPVPGFDPAPAGTVGSGSAPRVPVPIEHPLLKRERGYIGLWIRPNWAGSDGRTHRILRIGDPQRNGLLLEKAANGMLRYVMASPAKVTAARADVSHWKPGEWHHVVITWFGRDGTPLGLPLFVDRVAVDGPLAAGNTFLDPATLDDARLWLGDETTDATLDELILRDRFDTEQPNGQVPLVYRDYFRGMPCTRIAIEPDALRVPSDRRVVAGGQKQFGLRAGTDTLDFVTDYAVRYGQWADFDAKPFITWKSSDQAVATVDPNGLVAGVAPGKCKLTAEFRGLSADYAVEVIPREQPDLDLLYVERLPRYRWDRAKDRPDVGERVESVAHIENFGFSDVPAGAVVRFELLPERNGNFRLDSDEQQPLVREEQKLDVLRPREQRSVKFAWTWPAEPVWVRVSVDPDERIAELCKANNRLCELNTARPLRLALDPKKRDEFYTAKQINHVGSYSLYDWVHAQKLRFDVLVRETVLPCTSPDGIQDAFRTDNFYALKLGDTPFDQEPYELDEKWYDGGFPVNEHVHLMNIDAAILHEFGHCVLAQPDLYGYPVRRPNVLLTDEQGRRYAGGPLLPVVHEGDEVLTMTSAVAPPCGVAYASLMHDCHLWLHPSQAGHVQWFRGYRGPRFWGSQGRLLPMREHMLAIYDVADRPLVGAAVYVYHVAQTGAGDAGSKFFADRPKFMGHTDEDGRFKFPDHTDADWDDPDTDAFEGELPVWNPFGRAKTTTGAPYDTAFTPNVWIVEGLLLIKIVAGDQTEFAWMPMTEMNEQFFNGNYHRGVYPVRTSLSPAAGETALVRRPIPEAIRKQNLRPTAALAIPPAAGKAPAMATAGHGADGDEGDAEEEAAPLELKVACGGEIRLDGSASRDPEGQPLEYRWAVRGPGDVQPRWSQEPVYVGKAPREPTELEVVFYVIDGLRVSEPVTAKVVVTK